MAAAVDRQDVVPLCKSDVAPGGEAAVSAGSRACSSCSCPGVLGLNVAPARPSADGVREFTEPAARRRRRRPELRADAAGRVCARAARVELYQHRRRRGGVPPVVLLHSFDSSCLEFRRVMPLLAAAQIEAYAFDILGWGFTQTAGCSVSVDAKRAHLHAFVQQQLDGRPVLLMGSSLGCATIVDYVAAHGDAVEAALLQRPQVLIDGAPPVPEICAARGRTIARLVAAPRARAEAGVRRSRPLRHRGCDPSWARALHARWLGGRRDRVA